MGPATRPSSRLLAGFSKERSEGDIGGVVGAEDLVLEVGGDTRLRG